MYVCVAEKIFFSINHKWLFNYKDSYIVFYGLFVFYDTATFTKWWRLSI